MIGTTISHYRVLEKIGQGGMGEVFLAQDTSLDRKVALKFLPEFMQEDPTARKRFLREAKSAAALDHPYVCNIFEVSESDGKDFIAMEYVEGQTLKDKLAKGPLPLREALQTSAEIAEALEKAHGKGIVHRDLKPSNVMLTPEGHVKVMDFGLAKQLLPEDAGSQEQTLTANLTETGSTVGTPAYMSPEQLRGEAVDTRSDVFSFGVLLYEMITGVHPFLKIQQIETASAILRDDPSPLSEYVPELPEGLEQTIEKMLAKEAEQRYESTSEIRVNLEQLVGGTVPLMPARRPLTRRRWLALTGLAVLATVVTFVGLDVGGWRDGLTGLVGVSGPPSIESLAVLPLENLSGDPEQEYLATGMHDALITDLAKLGGLKRVIARSSVMRYQETDKPLPEIAEELNVDAVVTASVLRSGDRVHITAQLINAATEALLWADRYERELRDVLSLQNEIVSAIAQEIEVQLSPQEQVRLTIAPSVNSEAYEVYLKGRHLWIQENDFKSIDYFEQAVELDPDFALGHAALAEAYARSSIRGGKIPPEEAFPKARAAALTALKLDDTLAEAYTALAEIYFHSDWDWAAAEEELERALKFNPGYAIAYARHSAHLRAMQHYDESVAAAERARELDPFSIHLNVGLAWTYYLARLFDKSIAQSQLTLEMHPDSAGAHQVLGWAYLQKGMHEEAMVVLQKAVSLSSDNPWRKSFLAWAYAAQGKGAQAWEILDELKEIWDTQPSVVAQFHAVLGDKDQAFAWLNRAYDTRDPNVVWLNDLWFDSLRDDPRFEDLLRRMNLPL